MAAVVIGVDPPKGSHTAVVIDQAEAVLGQVRVRACAAQVEHPERRLFGQATPGPGTTLRSRPSLRKKTTPRATRKTRKTP